MTLTDRRSCSFVGAGVKCGEENERREIKLIIATTNVSA